MRWRTSRRSSSSTARRDSTTLLRERLSSITRQRSGWPRNSSRSCTRRMSTSDAGRKPRTPRSMISPPLTTSITRPSTASPLSAASSMRRHAFSKRARFLDRIRRPSSSSLVRTSASTSSPSATSSEGSMLRRIESSESGMTPSDLYPMSTRISSRSTRTTVPVSDVPLVEGDDLRVVIGHQLAVDLDPDSGLGGHDLSVRLGHIGRGFPQIPRGSARRGAAFDADCTEGRELGRRVAGENAPGCSSSWPRASRRRRRCRPPAAGRAGRRRPSPRARAARTAVVSTSGTSSSSSSWICSTRRAARPSSASRRWMRTIASLMMSAAEPWITVLTARRSPSERTFQLCARSSGIGRRRPSSVTA